MDRVSLLATTAYFFETDETGQRFGEVYGTINPNATGDDKYRRTSGTSFALVGAGARERVRLLWRRDR